MISHVLDTCALLDLAAGRWTDRVARRELAGAKRPVVLCVAVWEIARKLRVGKLQLPCGQAGVLDFVHGICRRHQIGLEPLTPEICHEAELLPPHHEDPFDRMVIALASQAKCPVFTTDQRFCDYPIQVLAQH
ncbi:MAG: type II toxin-antitoxin system VapC family toxin [Terrimicrobiaceae bacterium]